MPGGTGGAFVPGCTVRVHNLHDDVSSSHLRALFEAHELNVLEAHVFHDCDGWAYGQGEVVFATQAEARDALRVVDRTNVLGRKVVLVLVHGICMPEDMLFVRERESKWHEHGYALALTRTVRVCGLSPHANAAAFCNAFPHEHTMVRKVKLFHNKHGTPLGFGEVVFETEWGAYVGFHHLHMRTFASKRLCAGVCMADNVLVTEA